jgi:curved DNA-binding protein CbpA
MEGQLRQESLPGIVRQIYVGRKSGILHLSDDVNKRIYFKPGSLIFANSDVNDDRLGEFLIRTGSLSREQFELASKVMRETGHRFGKTLIEMGHMTEEQMLHHVHEQIEAIVYGLFRWEKGYYRFEETEDPVAEDIRLSLSTADIILEGIRRIEDQEAIQRGLGDVKGILRHSENPLLLYQKISLSAAEGFVLSRVDGVSTVADIASVSPLGDDETFRCVYGLVSAGVLEIEPPGAGSPSRRRPVEEAVELPKPEAETLQREKPPRREEQRVLSPEEQRIRDDIVAKHAAMNGATHYELLGVTPASSEVEIKRAYYSMAKKYHPDRHHSPHLQDVHVLLEELFHRIIQSYELLSNPLERRRYDASLRTEAPRGEVTASAAGAPSLHPAAPDPNERMAEARYREGKNYFAEGQYFDAIQSLRAALKLCPDKAPYHRQLAQALAKNPHWRKDAEEHFLRAVELDRFDAESYLGLGEIYETANMPTRAQQMWARAFEADPSNETAKHKMRGPATVEGLVGRLGRLLRRRKE